MDETLADAAAGPSQVVLRSPIPLQGKDFATAAEFDVIRFPR